MAKLRPCTPPPGLDLDLAALATSNKRTSPALYRETWTSLPERILAREPPHMLKAELVSVLDYKLAFGQNRPALRGMIAALSDAAVRMATGKSFAILAEEADDRSAGDTQVHEPDGAILRALDALTILRGVGPATASLVLSLLSPSTPFFSDEVAVAVLEPPGGRKGLKYTRAEYRRFLSLAAQESKGGSVARRAWERRRWMAVVTGKAESEPDGGCRSPGKDLHGNTELDAKSRSKRNRDAKTDEHASHAEAVPGRIRRGRIQL